MKKTLKTVGIVVMVALTCWHPIGMLWLVLFSIFCYMGYTDQQDRAAVEKK